MQNFEKRLRTCVRQEGRHLSDIIFRNWVINVSNQNCIYYRLFWLFCFFILKINKVTIIWKTCVLFAPHCTTRMCKWSLLVIIQRYYTHVHVTIAGSHQTTRRWTGRHAVKAGYQNVLRVRISKFFPFLTQNYVRNVTEEVETESTILHWHPLLGHNGFRWGSKTWVIYEKNITTDRSTQHYTEHVPDSAQRSAKSPWRNTSKITHTRALDGKKNKKKNDPSGNHRYNTRNRPTVGILHWSCAVRQNCFFRLILHFEGDVLV
jgi:hypothetical protein